MSQELVQMEAATMKRLEHLGRLVDGGIIGSLAHTGAVLTGFSVKIAEYDTLIVVRAILAGRPQVCFVGGSDLAGSLLKLSDLARRDKLRWRVDEFAKD